MVVGQFTQETDLVVLGAGPAGYAAAFRAAELGVQTTIVDARSGGALGGVCLHEGCVPSKTLLHIAESLHSAERASEFGIVFGKPKVDPAAIRSWVRKTVAKLSAGLDTLAKKHGVDRVEGRAHFEDSRNLGLIDGSIPRIRFKRALVAVGSVQKAHSELPFDGSHVLTPREAVVLERVPKTLLIVGSDYMAAELATIFAALGSIVTLALDGSRLLADADVDADLVRPVQKRVGEIASIHANCRPRLVEVGKKGALVAIPEAGAKPVLIEQVIVSVGHIGNTRGLQLEKTQAKVDAGEFIVADAATMRTDDPRIFAAGDITGPPLFADRAFAQGRIAAEIIAGRNSVFDARAIPSAIFTDPQLAWVGVMEDEAKRRGVTCAALKMPWGASGRAVGTGRAADGMTKIVFEPDSQLVLGVGIVGPHACELIGEAALAIEMGATLTDLAATIHPHPTMSEMIADAARSHREA
ncbi:MAG TPA: NAD(P)/FAD-dependent oxidoreductase [Phycisphaerales bacterium]|nr:NAD(P)/FAD-dependent oxidoreductase [Phycisphaerales bacterium]